MGKTDFFYLPQKLEHGVIHLLAFGKQNSIDKWQEIQNSSAEQVSDKINKINKHVKPIVNLSSSFDWSSSCYIAKQKLCILLEEHHTN